MPRSRTPARTAERLFDSACAPSAASRSRSTGSPLDAFVPAVRPRNDFRRIRDPGQIADNDAIGTPVAPDDDPMERRDPEHKTTSLTCLACNECVPLDPERMRLTVSHAVVCCPACGAETPARRADAYRGAVDAVAWGFAVYAGEAPEAAPTMGPEPRAEDAEPRPADKLLRRPPGSRARARRSWRREARASSSWPAHDGVVSRVPSFFGVACLPSPTRHG
jgi:hypothetical protein